MEYKTTKAMFSITPQTRIVVENPDLDDLEMDQVVEELAGMLEADKKQ
jgi:hypothetical protein